VISISGDGGFLFSAMELETLHPAGQSPARDAAREFVLSRP